MGIMFFFLFSQYSWFHLIVLYIFCTSFNIKLNYNIIQSHFYVYISYGSPSWS